VGKHLVWSKIINIPKKKPKQVLKIDIMLAATEVEEVAINKKNRNTGIVVRDLKVVMLVVTHVKIVHRGQEIHTIKKSKNMHVGMTSMFLK
jgi:hypothetical protein